MVPGLATASADTANQGNAGSQGPRCYLGSKHREPCPEGVNRSQQLSSPSLLGRALWGSTPCPKMKDSHEGRVEG